jgi:hypothetical protein
VLPSRAGGDKRAIRFVHFHSRADVGHALPHISPPSRFRLVSVLNFRSLDALRIAGGRNSRIDHNRVDSVSGLSNHH